MNLPQGCPTFLLVRATFMGKTLLRATCIFAKSKLQIIASLLYKIGAHFGQYYGNLSQKEGEDQKKAFAANPNWFREYQTKEGFGLDLFICQKMLSKPFHEEINRAKRPRGPHKTASRATGWAALIYLVIGVAGGGQNLCPYWNATNDKNNNNKALCFLQFQFL